MDKIMIIEDEQLIREELNILLSNIGYAVSCVIDFKDIVKQIKDLLKVF